MTREPLMMKLIRILTKYLIKSPKMGRKWELKMPRTEAEKARLIEKDKPIITDELKSQDKKNQAQRWQIQTNWRKTKQS